MRGTVFHGAFYGATDGDLRWNFTVTVRRKVSLDDRSRAPGRGFCVGSNYRLLSGWWGSSATLAGTATAAAAAALLASRTGCSINGASGVGND